MTNNRQSNFLSDHLERIFAITNNIAKTAADREFIYRGEPRFFENVSSNLYRQYGRTDGERFSIADVQQEILEAARKFTTETDAIEILSELQHYGGKTNLIDFTTDYLTALFFACDGWPLEDGRVILLHRAGVMTEHIREPRKLTSRAIVRKSIFALPPTGIVQPDHIVRIPKDMKQPLLQYLRHAHGISSESIYNDLHGFIRQQSLHAAAYRELHLGITYHKEDDADYQHAINHYTEAIALNPLLAQAYCGRGGAYLSNGDYDRAILDFDRALEIEEDHSCAYANRGQVWLGQEHYDMAIEDLTQAIKLNVSFDNETSSQAHFHRGTAYLLKGDYDSAVSDFNIVIEYALPPGEAVAYERRGNVYLAKRDLDQAIQDFNTAIRHEPGAENSFCFRGVAYVYKGEFARAIEDFDQAIVIDPEHSCGYHNRGIARLFLADWEGSRIDLSVAKSMGVDSITLFREDFGSVEEFKNRIELEMPDDIVAMLGQ